MNSDFSAAKNCCVSSNFAASKKNGQVTCSSKFAAAVSTLENKKMFAAFINVFSSAHSQIKTKTKISLLLPAENVSQ